VVECKYRGRVIGWLVTGADGRMRYAKKEPTLLVYANYRPVTFDGAVWRYTTWWEQ
jgi:hypothetical protein